MKAILINPYTRSITEVEYAGNLKDIYNLLDCHMIEAPINYPNSDAMYCDEEAWLSVDNTKELAGFMFPNWSYAILGKALIVGTDDEGNTISCKSVIDDFKDITWKYHMQMKYQGELMGLL